ncbi:DUF5132 domain-containing protein [Streptomyces griseoruber]|uniref:DUF5132 domain-containing protein n=1 Tax=Streptomyces griseoruber TaxID=1943 RepID=UPI0037B04D88
MPPVVPPFLIGLIAAPLAKRVVKPLMRGLVKTSVGLVLEVGRVAHEAREGVQDLAAEVTAEVTAEVVAAQMAGGDGARGTEPAPRPRRPPRPTGTTRPRPSARPPSPPERRTETLTPCPFQGKTSGIR